MKQSLFIGCLTLLMACNNGSAKTGTDTAANINPTTIRKPAENINPMPDQQTRREQSEAYCQAHGVPIYKNPHALFVDPEEKVTLREQDSVVDRAIILLFIGLKSEGLDKSPLDSLEQAWQIMTKASPTEKEYITAAQATQQQTTNANWRYEDLHVLLWALGFIDSLDYPDHQCDVQKDAKIMHTLNIFGFRQKAKLRSKKVILDQADLILRLDWACVNARTTGTSAPGGLNEEVVLERHYALNWLIRYLNADWDDVETNT